MALESASFLDGLVETNPAAGDLTSQGDDHIRLLKAVLKATFPGLTAAVDLTPTGVIQHGTIELGHASDTTLARAAAGFMSVEGSRVYQRNNLLGTVSQAAGVPTGSAMEAGSNANGRFIKFADGTLICYHSFKVLFVANDRMSGTWTFPASFVAGDQKIVTATMSERSPANVIEGISSPKRSESIVEIGAHDATLASITVRNPSTLYVASEFVWINAQVIGRWF